MAPKHLHIVSFDIPYPANYGGVIDVYYKIKALHALGVRIHLHCFEYGRAHQEELNNYCETVSYYRRSSNKALLLHALPYLVVSRRSENLVDALCRDDAPILFEGLHSCYHLGDNRLFGRKRLVRTHNVEHHYYDALAKAEESSLKKTYFAREASKLAKYELVLSEADEILAISNKDLYYFQSNYGKGKLVTAFHSNESVNVPEGLGKGALYHGNLAVAENDKAARYLIESVFSKIDVPLTIAGSNPTASLKKAVANAANVSLITDATPERMFELVRAAQVNVLPTFQATGIKLKLLLCLFSGRHVVCNTPMVEETGLEELTHVCDDPQEMAERIESLVTHEVAAREIASRIKTLEAGFSNRTGARDIQAVL